MTSLADLRARIDELDRQLIDVLAQRLAVCEEVARVKEGTDTPVIQPARVRDVVTSRRQWAIDSGVDPDFAEQVMRVLLAETHRIEVAGARTDGKPDKLAAPDTARSAIDTVVTRLDHVVIVVDDLGAAAATFTDRFGFHPVALADGEHPGIQAVQAGGAVIVLVGPEAGDAVAAHLAAHGSGIQHVSVDVLNADYARAALTAADAPLLTEIVVDDDGHEEFFTTRDAAIGFQLGFISRTGHRVGIGGANILASFAAPDEASDQK
ncbi:MAG TPA: chorismate mutase [Ilumatobacteraceae bacterium]|nr:chorismate mutase [Ilumatobacteraceae bacterium]